MPAHKKTLPGKKCRGCGKPFKSFNPHDTLCANCQAKLPKCGICRVVMAPEHGYMEGFARKVGKYNICGGCDYGLKTKGFLHISESQYLLPSGRVKVKAVLAEDKV